MLAVSVCFEASSQFFLCVSIFIDRFQFIGIGVQRFCWYSYQLNQHHWNFVYVLCSVMRMKVGGATENELTTSRQMKAFVRKTGKEQKWQWCKRERWRRKVLRADAMSLAWGTEKRWNEGMWTNEMDRCHNWMEILNNAHMSSRLKYSIDCIPSPATSKTSHSWAWACYWWDDACSWVLRFKPLYGYAPVVITIFQWFYYDPLCHFCVQLATISRMFVVILHGAHIDYFFH